MDLSTIGDVLLWCAVINVGLLVFWFVMFVLAHDWVHRFHSKWFTLSREKFDAIHYAGMAIFKIAIWVFNLVPFIAIQIAR